MRAPDWLLYIAAIAGVLLALFAIDQRQDAPRALPGSHRAGAFLPPASIYDPHVLTEIGPQESGLGSAFAINSDGWWLTARHVVDSCDLAGVIVSPGAAAPVQEIKTANFADLALIRTDYRVEGLALDSAERRLQIGQNAFHVGFPQGRPGEAVSRLVGREVLVAHGRYEVEQPVMVWAETGRTGGIGGALSGISGGPALSENGEVIGVTIAESARRGRLYTATPSSVLSLLNLERVEPSGAPFSRIRVDNYGEKADALRRSLAVAQVVCITGEDS